MRILLTVILLAGFCGCTTNGPTVNGGCHQKACKAGPGIGTNNVCPFNNQTGECKGGIDYCTGNQGSLNCECYDGTIGGNPGCLCALRPDFDV